VAEKTAVAINPDAVFSAGIIGWVQALPLAWAYIGTVLLFVALLACCWSLPRAQVLADASPGSWRDLRLWASVLIVLQLGLYVIFS
jgi:hypothetical protein